MLCLTPNAGCHWKLREGRFIARWKLGHRSILLQKLYFVWILFVIHYTGEGIRVVQSPRGGNIRGKMNT
jgi:hypothetical protein